jgi:hypothetical protein
MNILDLWLWYKAMTDEIKWSNVEELKAFLKEGLGDDTDCVAATLWDNKLDSKKDLEDVSDEQLMNLNRDVIKLGICTKIRRLLKGTSPLFYCQYCACKYSIERFFDPSLCLPISFFACSALSTLSFRYSMLCDVLLLLCYSLNSGALCHICTTLLVNEWFPLACTFWCISHRICFYRYLLVGVSLYLAICSFCVLLFLGYDIFSIIAFLLRYRMVL